MHRWQRFLILLFVLALAVVPLEAKKKKKSNSPNLKKWIEGPIRYITKKHDVEAFKALERDSDRILFIERFWKERDPHPETLTNEYRQLFWDRVKEANSLFLDAPVDGWRTDRGKIHILYGPPSEIQEDVDYRADAVTSTGGIIRWIYDGRAGGRRDVNPITVVPFVRGAGGEYKVSYDPKLSSVFWQVNPMKTPDELRFERWLEVAGETLGRSELSVMLDLGRMQEVPPQAQVLLERIETKEAYVTHDLRSQVDRLEHPQYPNDWLVSLTVDISYSLGRGAPAVMGRLRPSNAYGDDGDEGLRILDEASFKIAESDNERVAQARIRLQPGSYELTVMAADSDTAQTGLQRVELRLPSRERERMQLSDTIEASSLDPVKYAAMTSYDEPFTVGPFRVVPRFARGYRPGDAVQIFYEVYGATLPLDVSYQVQGQEEDGRWVDLGAPSKAVQTHHAQAWALPTSNRWPYGDYRIRIEVYDADGKLVTRDVPFTLMTDEAFQSSNAPSEGEGTLRVK